MVRMKLCIFLYFELTRILWDICNPFKTILFLCIDTGMQEATAAESTFPLPQPTTGNQYSAMTLSGRSDII